jgi:Uma2 family endonuclease
LVARESHRAAHPDEAFLLIEVSSTSLRDDLEWKVPLYARAEVQELWVVDVEGEQVLVHTDSAGAGGGASSG